MPYTMDNSALNSEVKTALQDLYASDWKDSSLLTPTEAREQSLRFAKKRVFPKALPTLKTNDITIPCDASHSISARLYYPESSSSDFVFIFYHGGGYVTGSVEQYDITCRWLCAELNAPLISVDYRLAPEHPFPIPVEDGYTAFEWIVNHAKKLGIQAKKIVVVGDSAGAHLATMVCILARDRKGPTIAWQWLWYPWTDNNFSRPSYQNYAEGFALSKDTMQWVYQLFTQGNHKTDYPTFPLAVTNLKHLPPAYVITAECDVLHDEGEKYAKKLQAEGNLVHYEMAKGMIHGFVNLYTVNACYQTSMKIIATMKQYLN